MDRAASIKHDVLEQMLLDESVEPTDLPLSLLEYITNGFSDDKQIGRGGFAVVYKGMLRKGTVAVKKLFNMYLHEDRFHQEVQCLMKAKHKNIVRFLGYCADTQGKMEFYDGKLVMAEVPQRLLCFEYLPKGSLHEYITDASRKLKWTKYYQIIKGVCKGLHYLHENRIVHLDLKPANILLDDNMVPKIADFGLSRCFDEKQSHFITSKLFGSLGYIAPEFHCGRITFKSDIYSLGVIIIEMLSGEKMYPEDYDVLESWGNRLEKLHREKQLEQLQVCAEIGKECTDYDPSRRPDARTIVLRLEEADIVDRSIVTDMLDEADIADRSILTDMLDEADHSHLKRGRSYPSSTRERRSHPGKVWSSLSPPCKTHSKVSGDPPPSPRSLTRLVRELCDYEADIVDRFIVTDMSNLSATQLNQLVEDAKRRAEIARLRELNTFKGSVESAVKMKGLNTEITTMSYSV